MPCKDQRRWPSNLFLQGGNLRLKQGFQLAVHTCEGITSAVLPACLCLGQEAFSHLYDLPAFGAQGSEKAKLFMGQLPPGIRTKGQKTGDQFGIYTVGLGACAPLAETEDDDRALWHKGRKMIDVNSRKGPGFRPRISVDSSRVPIRILVVPPTSLPPNWGTNRTTVGDAALELFVEVR